MSLDSYVVIQFPGAMLPAEYHNMIYSKWLRSLRYGNDYFKLIAPDAYYKNYTKQIDFVLNQYNCIVRLAVLSDDHDVVLGFSVIRGNILDYVHVHKDMRRQGIAKALIPQGIEVVTHLTKIGLSIFGKTKGVIFNPFA